MVPLEVSVVTLRAVLEQDIPGFSVVSEVTIALANVWVVNTLESLVLSLGLTNNFFVLLL